ncbi:Gfo/Idh/MocA family protein [Chryseotalea sanaruensis]|nr:Gfo/Idh/MocA family oxidoreductase [Chryseotalea sanaruensis]
MKILLIGLGSIGRRHLKHLQSIENVTLAALRTNKGARKEKSDILEFFSVEDALSFQPNGVIISNPTALHVQTALPFLKAGVKVLIEKPIADTLAEATLLTAFSEQIRVAYCMRFSPLVVKLTEIFANDPPFKISFKRSYYLPKWHPYADYTKEYTAIKALGGGVIRTLSHEIDMALHWFGEPQSIKGVTDRLSFLDIDTDDFAFFTIKTKSGARVNFELDFFSPINRNEGEAFTSKGLYYWTMEGIWYTPYESNKSEALFKFTTDAIDEMYQAQLKDFADFILHGGSTNATLKEAVGVLALIQHVEQQS